MIVIITIILISWGVYNGKCKTCGSQLIEPRHLGFFILGMLVFYWLMGEPQLLSQEFYDNGGYI